MPNAPEITASLALLGRMMSGYPSYVFITNEECTGARAMFRGRWKWEAVAEHLISTPTMVVIDDERASGFMRFRLYSTENAWPVCLAEIEIYFTQDDRTHTHFLCGTGQESGELAIAARRRRPRAKAS